MSDSTRSRVLEVMARAEASFEEISYAKYRELFKEQAAHILAALSAEGMVVVPVEPSEAMLHAGSASYDHPSVYMGGPSEGGKRLSARIYRAMLKAAASPYGKASMQEASAERAARSEQIPPGKEESK